MVLLEKKHRRLQTHEEQEVVTVDAAAAAAAAAAVGAMKATLTMRPSRRASVGLEQAEATTLLWRMLVILRIYPISSPRNSHRLILLRPFRALEMHLPRVRVRKEAIKETATCGKPRRLERA